MQKVTTIHSTMRSVDFKANRLANVAPKIIDTFVNDLGETEYVLENGNTQKAVSYDALWNPKKGKVNWKAKGQSMDSRHVL